MEHKPADPTAPWAHLKHSEQSTGHTSFHLFILRHRMRVRKGVHLTQAEAMNALHELPHEEGITRAWIERHEVTYVRVYGIK